MPVLDPTETRPRLTSLTTWADVVDDLVHGHHDDGHEEWIVYEIVPENARQELPVVVLNNQG